MNMQVTTAPTGNLTHNATNDTRLSDFMKEVREEGRNSAMGKDALPALAYKFIRAVADEVIDIAKDADGDDAAARVFKAFANSEGNKQIHDRNGDSVKAQISKLRALQKMASNPKWDAVQVSNDVFATREDYKKDGIDVKPAYAALVDVAREQLKSDQQLTVPEIGCLITPTTTVKEVTLESKLEKIAKQLEEIITGEGKDGIKDQSQEIISASEMISVRRGQLALLKQVAEDDKAQRDLDARKAARNATYGLVTIEG